MRKVYIYGLVLLFILILTQSAYSQNPDISVRASFGLETAGGSLVMRGGQWVPEENTTVTGQITLVVKLDGDAATFPTNITGTKIINGQVTYPCENGESFYLDGRTPHPIVSSKFKAGSVYLEKLIDEYRKNKTDMLAWSIWKHVDK